MNLVLTDQAVFLLQHEQMHRRRQLKTMPLLSALIRVGNKQKNTVCENTSTKFIKNNQKILYF